MRPPRPTPLPTANQPARSANAPTPTVIRACMSRQRNTSPALLHQSDSQVKRYSLAAAPRGCAEARELARVRGCGIGNTLAAIG